MSPNLPRGVVAVIRTSNAEHALTIARALAPTRIAGIEVTLTVPDAVQVIARLVSEGVERVGAGTVRTVEQVLQCVDVGAQFLVSPHTGDAVVATAVARGVPVVPGAMTPTEIMRALSLGASAAKVFPASVVGGVSFVRTLLEPLPGLPLVVSGGIEPAEVPDYVAAGAVGVCLGAALWRLDDVAAGDVEAVRAHAEAVLDVAQPVPDAVDA